MKKIAVLAAVAAGALTLTSCGAPSISVQDARVEAQAIRAKMEESGDQIAGNNFNLKFNIKQEVKYDGQSSSSKTTGEIKIDILNRYFYSSTQSVTDGEKMSLVTEGWQEGNLYYVSVKVNGDGEEIDTTTTFDATSTSESEAFVSTLMDTYDSITSVFTTAVESIFTYLESNEDALSERGVKLGSYGEGSLVITENISVSGQKSEAYIEFADYKLKEMSANIRVSAMGATQIQEMSYKFDYSRRYNK